MIIVPPPRSQPTSRSRALTTRLRETIAEFQHREPKVTQEEVAQALRDAMPDASRTGSPRPALVVAVLAGGLTAIGVGLTASRFESAGRPVPLAPVVAIVIVGLGAVFALVLRSRSDR